MTAAESAVGDAPPAATQPKVLVVDDTPHNVKLLAAAVSTGCVK